MAEPGRTVRVTGLPAHIKEERLKDKVCIHFQKSRNRGGEIDSVSFDRTKPGTALITFEDHKVARRVTEHSQHILEVDGKKYQLIVTKSHQSSDPDRIILSLLATVDCSQLPGDIDTLTGLQKNHPDVQQSYDAAKKLCTLQGPYSKVQSLLAHLFHHSSLAEDSGQMTSNGSRPVHKAQEAHHGCESQDVSGGVDERRDPGEGGQICSNEWTSNAHQEPLHDGCTMVQPDQVASHLSEHSPRSEEDLSLIVDADMYKYLQKFCGEEYGHILNQFGIDVVEETNEGLVTLFLHAGATAGEGGLDLERIKQARKAISELCHEKETTICQAHLLKKKILCPPGVLQRTMENLRVRFPKVLLNEDDRNVYFIGSRLDVLMAKSFILDNYGVTDPKDDSLSLKVPSFDLSSPFPSVDDRDPLTVSDFAAGSVDHNVDQILPSEEAAKRADTTKKYRLAARFKNSGYCMLGSRPGDFFQGPPSQSMQTHASPVSSHDARPDTVDVMGDTVPRAVDLNTKVDAVKGGGILHSAAYSQNKTLSSSYSLDSPPKRVKAPQRRPPLDDSETNIRLPTEVRSTLRRSSSFSGMSQTKVQGPSQKIQDNPVKSSAGVRVRSSSFSSQRGSDKIEDHKLQMTICRIMWFYIKEVYRIRLKDVAPDVQIKECISEGRADLTLVIRGADKSKVFSCQSLLQKLVDSSSVDFFHYELPLSELGVVDPADETLQACCEEFRSRFKKIFIKVLRNKILLLGPQQICLQVSTSLHEVYAADCVRLPEEQDFSSFSISNWSPSTSCQINGDQSTDLHCSNGLQVKLDHDLRKDNVRRSLLGGSKPSGTEFDYGSARRDPVTKEKVARELGGQRTFVKSATNANDRTTSNVALARINLSHGTESTVQSVHNDGQQQRQAELQHTSNETMSARRDLECRCPCGGAEATMQQMECGVPLGSRRLDATHIQGRVCHRVESTPGGIQGKMNYAELNNVCVPGHMNSAVKITYLIPNGIQGEGHPSPGRPFQGAVFKTYFPDCEETRRLLPRLLRAFRQGLTFRVAGKEPEAHVCWGCIPHKTSLQGGMSGNGYPDATYLSRLSEILTCHGIEEQPPKRLK